MEKKISNMVIENSFNISISRDDAYRIERMLEKTYYPTLILVHKAKYILEIMSAKIKYAAFQGYDTKVDISYKEACDIYRLIKAFIDSSDIAEDRKDDDNAVFGEDAIAWERLIDVLDYIKENQNKNCREEQKMENNFVENVEVTKVSNIKIVESVALELDLEDAKNICSMFEEIRHPANKNILSIIIRVSLRNKIRYAELKHYESIRIDYDTACTIIQYINSYLNLNSPEGRTDDDNAVFGDRAISYERLIDAVDFLESKF